VPRLSAPSASPPTSPPAALGISNLTRVGGRSFQYGSSSVHDSPADALNLKFHSKAQSSSSVNHVRSASSIESRRAARASPEARSLRALRGTYTFLSHRWLQWPSHASFVELMIVRSVRSTPARRPTPARSRCDAIRATRSGCSSTRERMEAPSPSIATTRSGTRGAEKNLQLARKPPEDEGGTAEQIYSILQPSAAVGRPSGPS
jgi:hypothetical protein